MRVLDLFAGIGGFTLGLERAGFETVAFCEIEEYPQKVLKKHWPDVPIYHDVKELNHERLKADGIHGIDVITGGFPCQDISTAGKQAGIEGKRSGLWSEVARLISEIQPRFAIMENVTALISGDRGRWFGRVLGDLAEIGYDAEWHCIPASELGAHHHRDRIWIIAYPQKLQCNGGDDNSGEQLERGQISESGNSGRAADVANTNSQRSQGGKKPGGIGIGRAIRRELTSGQFCSFGGVGSVEPTICRGANGIPDRAHRIKALGNAVVPQIPEIIGRAIMQFERDQ